MLYADHAMAHIERTARTHAGRVRGSVDSSIIGAAAIKRFAGDNNLCAYKRAATALGDISRLLRVMAHLQEGNMLLGLDGAESMSASRFLRRWCVLWLVILRARDDASRTWMPIRPVFSRESEPSWS